MKDIRTILGSFLFDSNALSKPASVLSGGERNRLGMIRVLLQNANFLMLDEPTNHLDIPSKEILLEALINYQGTILFVSHDQDFVNRLATHILELNAEKASFLQDHMMNICIKKTKWSKSPASKHLKTTNPKQETAPPSKRICRFKRACKKIHTIEQRIAKHEALIKKLSCHLKSLNTEQTLLQRLNNNF